MARRSGSANSAGTACHLVSASLLLFLVRCSDAFVVMKRLGAPSGRASYYYSSRATTAVTAVESIAEVGPGSLYTSTGRDARRERMATLGKVRWQPVQSGHGTTMEESAAAVAASSSSRDGGFLGSSTTSLSGSSSSSNGGWGGGTAVRMGLGRGVGRGFSSVRRAVARVLGRGGGGKVRYHGSSDGYIFEDGYITDTCSLLL